MKNGIDYDIVKIREFVNDLEHCKTECSGKKKQAIDMSGGGLAVEKLNELTECYQKLFEAMDNLLGATIEYMQGAANNMEKKDRELAGKM